MSAFSRGNELFVDEDYDGALQAFTEAVETGTDADAATKAGYYVKRSAVLLKLLRFDEALDDAMKAAEMNPRLAIAYLRQGTAAFHMEEFESAKLAFERGKACLLETGGRYDMYDVWIRKCEAELDEDDASEDILEDPPEETTAKTAPTEDAPERLAPVQVSETPVQVSGPQFRHDWYQTATYIVITVMVKGKSDDQIAVDIGESNVTVTIGLDSGSDFVLDLDLFDAIVVEKSSFKVKSTKVEVRLEKQSPFQWPALCREGEAVVALPSAAGNAPAIISSTAKAYSSNRDWNAIEQDLKKQEEDEKLEGEDALNKLFRDIYSKANEDTRRAMNKSFQTSGGTVLSTNWGDVSDKDYEKEKVAPDGMEWRSWEGDKLTGKSDKTEKE